MSAPVQGTGGGSGGGLSPSTFLGTFSGSNPSSPSNGYWWYRVDTGQLFMNVNGTIMPVQNTGNVTVIASNTTIANTDVFNDVIVLDGITLTIYGTVVFHGNVTVLNGATLLSSNPSASSSSTQTNNYQFLGTLYLNGTYSIAQYNTDSINASATVTTVSSENGANPTITGSALSIGSGYTLTVSANVAYSVATISGSGTLAVGSGYTLTVGANATWSIPTVTGAGTIATASGVTITVSANMTWSVSSFPPTVSISSGYTLTLAANYTITATPPISGSGTLAVGSGYTLTVNTNITWGSLALGGGGTLSIGSGYTFTQGAAMTLSIAAISVAGTWANAGYDITIPSGATVKVTVSGSLTTASTAGTLTVDGTCYWFGAIGQGNTSSDMPSFALSLAGSGIFIGAISTNSSASGGNTISFSNTGIGAGSTYGSANGSGSALHYCISSISGSAVGKYGLGHENATNGYYFEDVLIYIGTANQSYSINSSLTFADGNTTAGDSMSAFNSSSSAGTITITGTLYV